MRDIFAEKDEPIGNFFLEGKYVDQDMKFVTLLFEGLGALDTAHGLEVLGCI